MNILELKNTTGATIQLNFNLGENWYVAANSSFVYWGGIAQIPQRGGGQLGIVYNGKQYYMDYSIVTGGMQINMYDENNNLLPVPARQAIIPATSNGVRLESDGIIIIGTIDI